MKNIHFGYQMIHECIGSKWVYEIIMALDDMTMRYSELLDQIEGISATELRRKLKLLQAKHLIQKVEDDQKMFYALSPFGDDIAHILHHLVDISQRYEELVYIK